MVAADYGQYPVNRNDQNEGSNLGVLGRPEAFHLVYCLCHRQEVPPRLFPNHLTWITSWVQVFWTFIRVLSISSRKQGLKVLDNSFLHAASYTLSSILNLSQNSNRTSSRRVLCIL